MDDTTTIEPGLANVIELSSVQCSATSKQTGRRCAQKAIPGGRVCRFHGGAAPQVRAAALARIAQARDLALDRLIERLAPPNVDPDSDGEFVPYVDTKVLLDVVDKLTAKVQLLSGEATSREESNRVQTMRQSLELKLDQISPRVQELIQTGRQLEMIDVEGEEVDVGDNEPGQTVRKEGSDGTIDTGGAGETP